MTPKQLKTIKRKLEEMRQSPQNRSSREFESMANQLGRYKDSRGKEPTYIRADDPLLSPPLSIPNRQELKVGTARCIIDALLSDVDTWEIHLQGED